MDCREEQWPSLLARLGIICGRVPEVDAGNESLCGAPTNLVVDSVYRDSVSGLDDFCRMAARVGRSDWS